MNNDIITLPQALPDREYIIKNILPTSTCSKSLHGYGITPGAKIKLLFTSPSGNPYAYEVLGTVIALRTSDSKNIIISPAAFS